MNEDIICVKERQEDYCCDSLTINLKSVFRELRPRLYYTVFIRRRYKNVPFWPTVYTVRFSYPASNEDCCIAKY